MHRIPNLHRMLSLAVLLLGIQTQRSFALEVLADNLAQTSDAGSVDVSNTQWVSQSFTTTTAGSTLTGVSLRLFNNSGTTGTFALQIWNSEGTGGRPGAQVGSSFYSGLAQNLSSSGPGLLEVTGLNVTLAANRTYYIIARGESLTDVDLGGDLFPGSLAWSATASSGGTGFPAAKWASINSGASWNGPFTGYNYGMRIVAVPEPSTWALAGLSSGVLAWAVRRRSRSGERAGRA